MHFPPPVKRKLLFGHFSFLPFCLFDGYFEGLIFQQDCNKKPMNGDIYDAFPAKFAIFAQT